jgi:hypothetical protein
MSHADFAYVPANESAVAPLSVSIFADRPHVRAELCEDVEGAGLALHLSSAVGTLLECEGQGASRMLGDLVVLDCPAVDAAMLAVLARLDMHAARSGLALVISTSVAALDDVFACCDQSNPQILVDPTRAERVVALGRVYAGAPGRRVRELSQDDRLALLRLTEQVGEIALRLERLGSRVETEADGLAGAFRFESPSQSYKGPKNEAALVLARSARPTLPDPRLIRRIIRQRQMRARFFDGELFADPVWDILLDLTAARAEHTRVSVTSACIASGVPATTALRWITQMTEAGLIDRVRDDTDRRRAFVALSDTAANAMARYFEEAGAVAQAI